MRQKLENYLYGIWYSHKRPPLYLKLLSVIFDGLRRTRLALFRSGLIKKISLGLPVLVVGNITVGGTGKTPLVLFLIDELKRQGLKVGVISRGYGGTLSTSKKQVTVLSPIHTAQEVGDEPYMIYARTQAVFAISRNRVLAAQTLMDQFPDLDLIISDDGLQHYKMQRAIEIVVLDGERGVGNGKLLPAGPLREPVDRLQDVDLVLSNGNAGHASLQSFETLSFKLTPVRFMGLNSNKSVGLETFRGKTLHAFAGIGNPQRFFTSLEQLGLTVVPHELGDHGFMPDEFFKQYSKELIVMTEKDAVKYPDIRSGNIWYLPVSLEMHETDKKQFLQLVLQKLGDVAT